MLRYSQKVTSSIFPCSRCLFGAYLLTISILSGFVLRVFWGDARDRFHVSLCRKPVFNNPFSPDKYNHSTKTGKICYQASETKHCPHDQIQRSTALTDIQTLQCGLFNCNRNSDILVAANELHLKAVPLQKKNKQKVNSLRKKKQTLFMP